MILDALTTLLRVVLFSFLLVNAIVLVSILYAAWVDYIQDREEAKRFKDIERLFDAD